MNVSENALDCATRSGSEGAHLYASAVRWASGVMRVAFEVSLFDALEVAICPV
ncbi:hypothetical protein [Pendulispora albinea]|uniref:Uncharacterized protein n=1 Tax=Pendulispora albinea TaxID=2741071 RepID=A0ABZ2LIX0_9BACT